MIKRVAAFLAGVMLAFICFQLLSQSASTVKACEDVKPAPVIDSALRVGEPFSTPTKLIQRLAAGLQLLDGISFPSNAI